MAVAKVKSTLPDLSASITGSEAVNPDGQETVVPPSSLPRSAPSNL